MTRTIFIGDVHGCYQELCDLIAALSLEVEDRLVFVGDLVDKGPQSLRVLRYVQDLTHSYPGSLVVAGNHEEKALRFAKRGEWVEPWCEEAEQKDWNFIESMPLTWYDDGLNIRVVHGGVSPNLIQKVPDLLERIESMGRHWHKGGGKVMRRIRSELTRLRHVSKDDGKMLSLGDETKDDPNWMDVYDGSLGTIVFGHQPQLTGEVAYAPHAICVDTGCVFGKRLTALIVKQSQPGGVDYTTVSVAAHRSYAKPYQATA